MIMLVTAAIFMVSCGDNLKKESTPTPAPTTYLPRVLFKDSDGFTGGSRAAIGACAQVTLCLENGYDSSAIIGASDVQAIISTTACLIGANSAITFYSDSGCVNSTNSIVVKAGKSTANFYYKLAGKACHYLGASADKFNKPSLFQVNNL